MEIDKIREFVRSNIVLLDENVILGDDDKIFELGLVDSPFAIELVLFIEGEFGIEILDDELNISNFSSIGRIAEFVKTKKTK